MRVIKVFALMLIALISIPSFGMSLKSSNTEDDSLKIIEKVYLHTDRQTYYPSDNIWFKAYVVDASDRTLSDYSKNLHVELISPASKIIDSRIARIDGGLAKGDFRLPGKLESGSYVLRAYTNYMRNFGDELIYNRILTIVNPEDSIKPVPEVNNTGKNKLEISFFPEGGSLVDGVPSIVAFKVNDANGRACDAGGEIYTTAGEFVASFKSSHKGMGSFLLSPVPGTRYVAIAGNSNGDTVIGDVPKSFPTGVGLNVSVNKNNELYINVRTNNETLTTLLNEELTIEISARSQLYKKAAFVMKSEAVGFTIPVYDLPDGIYVLTLARGDKKPLCERMIYIHNSDDVYLKVETDKAGYNSRDSVSVCLNLDDTSGNTEIAFLSLSATEDIFAENSTQFPENISSWFLLESDIRGEVEDPAYYFDPSNKNRLKDLDLLLLTHGWRDFEWKYNNTIYLPERGFTISGRVRKTLTNKPLKDALVNIGIFKAGNPVIRLVPTDSTGRFFLDEIVFSGGAKLIVSSIDQKDRLKGWVILDSLHYPHAKVPNILPETKFNRNDTQNLQYQPAKNKDRFIQYAEITNSVSRKYKLSDTIKPGEVNIIAKRADAPKSARARSRYYLRSTPDREIIITPMEEHYNSTQQLIEFRLLKPITSNMPIGSGLTMQNPLFMVDGVFVTENELRALPVSWVERIDVANNQSVLAVFKLEALMYGPIDNGQSNDMAKLGLGNKIRKGPMDGVISIITKDGYSSESGVLHSATIQISGYNEPRIFFSPRHHTTLEKDYKPDFRATLFWEPDIEIRDSKDYFLNYFNDDKTGKINITVEGITSGGIPVTGKAEYEVK